MARKQKSGFGVRLRELREQAGLSQQSLAAKVELSVSGIAHIEQGLREPGWPTVRALARALGVSCAAFESEQAKA